MYTGSVVVESRTTFAANNDAAVDPVVFTETLPTRVAVVFTGYGPVSRTPSRPPLDSNGPLAVPQCTPVPRVGLGLVQGTSTLHMELGPGYSGCSQRW
eukprot:1176731-Prorocentrum_minimum.AAC.2